MVTLQDVQPQGCGTEQGTSSDVYLASIMALVLDGARHEMVLSVDVEMELK